MFVLMATIGVQKSFAQTTVGANANAPYGLVGEPDAIARLTVALDSRKTVMSQFIPGSANWDRQARVFDLYSRTLEALLGGGVPTVNDALRDAHAISYGMSAVPVTLVTKTESETALADAYALLKL